MGRDDQLTRGDGRPLRPKTYDPRRGSRPPSTPNRIRALVPALLVAVVLLGAACSRDAGADGDQQGAGATLSAALRAHADGRLDEAARLYHQVLVLDPQNKFAYYNLGLIAQTHGLDQDAADDYGQALAIDPVYAPALFNLAIIRTEQGDAQAAVDLYRQAIAANPTDARAHLNLGFLLLEAGERGPSTHEFRAAVELDPSLASRIPDDIAAG